ncbi:MAG: ChaN family lipoprotein [Gemmatimonadota bacterium]|jgi:uncharacterized iron-regulated protein
MNGLKRLLVALTLSLGCAASAMAQDPSDPPSDTAYAPGEYRVFTGDGDPSSIDDLVAAMGPHSVVFIGETHDDPTGHLLEKVLLERAWAAYGPPARAEGGTARPVALSLEFFQRDVQPILDEYLEGLITEESFRNDSRPWPRYETDYRPLIEFSKENGLDVIAANAPRRYVTRVTRHGRESLRDLGPRALESLPPLPYGQPSEAYRNQWIQVISEVMEQEGTRCGVPVDNPPAPPGSHANMGNQLHSQVLWDATMAWSVARYLESHPDALVVHMVGGFHVARGTGIPEHLETYRPGASYMIVMLRPVEDIDAFEPAPEGRWGDYVIQTDGSRTLEAIECREFRREHGGS